MTFKKEDDADLKVGEEPEFVASAVPVKDNSNEPPIPAGHSRFYCNKCHTVRVIHRKEERIVLRRKYCIHSLLTYNSSLHSRTTSLTRQLRGAVKTA